MKSGEIGARKLVAFTYTEQIGAIENEMSTKPVANPSRPIHVGRTAKLKVCRPRARAAAKSDAWAPRWLGMQMKNSRDERDL